MPLMHDLRKHWQQKSTLLLGAPDGRVQHVEDVRKRVYIGNALRPQDTYVREFGKTEKAD